MKKKLASVILSASLIFSAVPQFVMAADYEIPAMKTAEDILTAVKEDAAKEVSLRDEQKVELDKGVAAFYADGVFDYSTAWDQYIDKIYDSETQQRVKKYMQMRYIAKYSSEFSSDGAALKAALEALDSQYDTSSMTLEEASNTFSTYQNAAAVLYNQYADKATLFNDGALAKEVSAESYDEFVKQSLLDATKNLIGFVFSSEGIGTDNKAFDYSFETNFMKNDIEKKIIALFFGQDITKEVATGAVIDNVKAYVKTNDSAVSTVKNALNNIFVADKADAVDAAYDLVGTLVAGAYAGNDNLADAVRIFGNGTDKGVIELAMNVADSDKSVQNIWLNLFIRRFVQMKTVLGEMTTIDASNVDNKVKSKVEDGTSVPFTLKELSEYGLSDNNITLKTSYFNVVCDSDDVTYKDGMIEVNYNSSKDDEYDAVLTVYRAAGGTGVEDYIEDYAITVVNEESSSGRRGRGGSGSGTSKSTVKITFNTEEGGGIEGVTNPETGTTNRYVIKPNAGYRVDKVYVDGVETDFTTDGNNIIVTLRDVSADHNITATFIKLLSEDSHISYIVGYPDGSFKPYNNISREEAATIFFRLLTNEARDKYLSSSQFGDVENDRWSSQAIGTLAKMDILTGYEDGSFRPSNKITRAEFATIAYRFYNLSYSGADLFNDIESHWAASYINAIADAAWIQGYEDGSYKPEQQITRGETVTIVNRMLSRAVNVENIADGAKTFSDCKTSDWFYTAVMEAANSHDYADERLEDGTEVWESVTENPEWSKYED